MMTKSPVLLTVRYGSSRLPGKCLLPFFSVQAHTESVLAHVINRAANDSRRIIVCTGDAPSNNLLVQVCKDLDVEYYVGSENNKVRRWFDCFDALGLKWAHFVDVDDPFFCNDELDLSIQSFHETGKLILSTEKSRSGNASVGITLSAGHLAAMNDEVGHYPKFEIVDDLIARLFIGETHEFSSLDPFPNGTRLTLDYFEDYLALSHIKLGLSTRASRMEIFEFVRQNPWILSINAKMNVEWKKRQHKISLSQES